MSRALRSHPKSCLNTPIAPNVQANMNLIAFEAFLLFDSVGSLNSHDGDGSEKLINLWLSQCLWYGPASMDFRDT